MSKTSENNLASSEEARNLIFASNAQLQYMDRDIVKCLIKDETFLITQMAFTRNGVTLSEIKKNFGCYGLQQLNLLLEKGVLISGEDGVLRAPEASVNATPADLKEMLRLALDQCYDSLSHEEDGAHLSYQTESVNLDGLQAILEQLKATQARIRQILYSPAYYGNIKIFVGMVCDKIAHKKNSNANPSH